jgi:hypothetical protein
MCTSGDIPFVEPTQSLVFPHLTDDISGGAISCSCIVHLQPRSDHLIWVRNTPSEYLRHRGETEKVPVAKLGLALTSSHGDLTQQHCHPIIFELFVNHELDGPVRNTEERRYETPIEALQPVGAKYMYCALHDARVCSRSIAARREHPCLNDPYWIGEDSRQNAWLLISSRI